ARAPADRPGAAGRGADRAAAGRGPRAPAAVRRPGTGRMTQPLVLAIDGGNSKTDLALVRADGEVLALVRGPLSSPHHLGLEGSLGVLGGLLADAVAEAGLPNGDGPVAEVGQLLLAGVDFPAEGREMPAEADHDAVAAAIVEQLAAEVVTMVRVTLERLDLTGEPVEVALGGGLMQSGDSRLIGAIEAGLREIAPAATLHVTSTPPIVGAA